jgi:glycosyltransferase involved in cell wall biosynthesis
VDVCRPQARQVRPSWNSELICRILAEARAPALGRIPEFPHKFIDFGCSEVAMPGRSITMLTTDRAVDRRILLEADALEADGWTVAILAPPGQPDDSRVTRVARPNAADAPAPNPVAGRAGSVLRRAVSSQWPLISRVRAVVTHHVVNPEPFQRRLMLPAALARSADIIVAHDLPMLPTAAAAARHHSAKLVYDSHELYCEQEFGRRIRRSWSEIERRHIGHCDAVITINPSIAAELQRRYRLDRVHVVQNAERAGARPPANERLFHTAFGLHAAAIVVLFQGGLSAHRHLDSLIDAMDHVAAPAVHLVLLGDGPIKGWLLRRARRSPSRSRIHFHPAVPQRDLPRFTAAADIGIIPYQATCLNNLYCTPNKLFEFVAAGVPIIATDLPELKRVVAGHGLGMISDTSTPRSIASAIDEFVRDEARMRACRVNALAARRQLNWETESKVLVEIYRALERVPLR